MYGVIDFYKAAKEAGIKPILGCEVYVAPGSRFEKTPGESEDRYYHLVLLAENNTGYQNLMKIVSRGFTEGFYYKPRVDYEVLTEYHEGIIALSACLAGEVQRYLARGMYEMGMEAAKRYENIFGKGNFFLELQDHGISTQQYVNQQLVRMSEEIKILNWFATKRYPLYVCRRCGCTRHFTLYPDRQDGNGREQNEIRGWAVLLQVAGRNGRAVFVCTAGN